MGMYNSTCTDWLQIQCPPSLVYSEASSIGPPLRTICNEMHVANLVSLESTVATESTEIKYRWVTYDVLNYIYTVCLFYITLESYIALMFLYIPLSLLVLAQ